MKARLAILAAAVAVFAVLSFVRPGPRYIGRVKVGAHAAVMVGNVPLENLPASAVPVWQDGVAFPRTP